MPCLSLGGGNETARQRGGKAAKTRRDKTLKRGSAPKIAGRRSSPVSNIHTDVVRLTRERDEALEQQISTAEILGAISGSPTDTQPVFDAIVQSGLKLFPGAATTIVLPDGDQMQAVAIARKYSKSLKKHGDAAFPLMCSTGPKCMARRSRLSTLVPM